nr:aspartyl protease AED3-like [Tanacetum cinerariifolium]
MLMALDTSTDMALVPSVGCVGCSSVMYDSTKSQSFSSLACGADQCKQVVNIPPSALAFNPNTGGGTIIDSGTVFTRLIDGAYTAVRDEFRRRMGKAVLSSLGGELGYYNQTRCPFYRVVDSFSSCQWSFVKREGNKVAHSIAAWVVGCNNEIVLESRVPDCALECAMDDVLLCSIL